MLKHIPGKRWIDETVPSYNWSQCPDPGGYPANTGHCPTIFLRRHTKATQGTFYNEISIVFHAYLCYNGTTQLIYQGTKSL